jgi:ribonuclease P protein component
VKILRLPNKDGFRQIKIKGRRIKALTHQVAFLANDLASLRYAIVISKKQVASAVKRNFLRRIMRESLRANRDALGAKDMLMMLNKDCLSLNRKALRKTFDDFWLRVKA